MSPVSPQLPRFPYSDRVTDSWHHLSGKNYEAVCPQLPRFSYPDFVTDLRFGIRRRVLATKYDTSILMRTSSFKVPIGAIRWGQSSSEMSR